MKPSRQSKRTTGSGITAPLRTRNKPGVPLVRALDRGIAILRAFSAAKPQLTLTELSQAVELDKGTVRRLLHTLTLAGLVDHDETSALFSLGVGVLELASAVETGRELREIAAPYLNDVAERCGATAFLWVPSEGMALCASRARPTQPSVDASWFTVGARAPLNCGGGPRVLLAYLTPTEQKLALSRPLLRRTPASQIDKTVLMTEAARIRAQGWELAVDDFVLGLAGLGVPIFNRAGALAGSLSITSVTTQLVKGDKPLHLAVLQTAAAAIGAKAY